MKTYRLVFPKDRKREAQVIEFDAADAGEALIIAHREATERSAELWCDGKCHCTIRRDEADFWQIEQEALLPGTGTTAHP